MTHLFFRNLNAKYEDVPAFCASFPIERVAEPDYVLTPGYYIELPDELLWQNMLLTCEIHNLKINLKIGRIVL
nr:hypothetical protein [uncultured Macellibacteroides sp.]